MKKEGVTEGVKGSKALNLHRLHDTTAAAGLTHDLFLSDGGIAANCPVDEPVVISAISFQSLLLLQARQELCLGATDSEPSLPALLLELLQGQGAASRAACG